MNDASFSLVNAIHNDRIHPVRRVRTRRTRRSLFASGLALLPGSGSHAAERERLSA